MGNPVRHTVAITTDASGDATAYTPDVNGTVVSIKYNKTDYANGVDLFVTGNSSGIEVLSVLAMDAAASFAPQQVVNLNTDGVAKTAYSPIVVANEKLKLVIADGGNAKSGSFEVVVI